MKAPHIGLLLLSTLIASLLSQAAMSQGLQVASPQNPFVRQSQNLDRVATPSMQFFGNRNLRTAPRKEFRRRIPAPQPLQLRGTKPFESVQRLPTLSPYHNLNLRESAQGLPNYYAFVRPMQRQQIANQKQAANLRKLQQKVRVATATGIVSNNSTGGVPTTGHSSQFLNLGGYFSEVQ